MVVAQAAQAHRGAVGLADDDGAAALFHALREGAVDGEPEVLQRADAAEGGGPAGLEIEQVLDGDGNAVEGAERPALHDGRFRLLRGGAGVVIALVDEGVEAGVARLDARDDGFEDFGGRYLLRADLVRDAGGGRI